MVRTFSGMRWATLVIGLLLVAAGLAIAAKPVEKVFASNEPSKSNASQRDPLPIAAAIDREITNALLAAKIPASLPVGDLEFLRRASLDIIGRIPTVERAMAFAADKDPNKRHKALDELLADREYGTHFGTIWYHLLVVPNDDNRKLVRHSFADWLADQFNQDRGWDRIVSDILTVEGDVNEHPAAVFWLANSMLEKQEAKLKPQAAVASATQRFLGTQYQCAECHNHPFTGFKQTDFWSLAAFFGKVNLEHASKKATKDPSSDPGVREKAPGQASIEIPEKDGVLVTAKFPDGTAHSSGAASLRAEFAKWCTSPSNDLFAKAAVNRLWAHFFGRGLVEPVDDFREGNDPSHPELLRLLAEEFKASGYDLKHLIRCICETQAYQGSSDASVDNTNDDKMFSHMALKTMSAEVLLKSLTTAAGHDLLSSPKNPNAGAKKNAASPMGQFIAQFNTAEEPDLPDYAHGVPQVLRLMNSGDLEKSCPTLDKLTSAGGIPAKTIEGLYWAALSRPPRPTEMQKMTAFVAKSGGGQKAYHDVYWILLNSSEFVLNH